MKSEKIIQRAETSRKETKDLDFKINFDTSSNQDWCEIIKDIIAFTNSGGGLLLFGVDDNGITQDIDLKHIFNLDPATITDKIEKYTNYSFDLFEIRQIKRDNILLPCISIFGSDIPLVFTNPGTYQIENGKQRTAFSKGSIYFRHGAKSEPANQTDLNDAIDKVKIKTRNEILNNLTQVINAPEGHKVYTFPEHIKITTSNIATPVRVTDDDNATAIKIENPDEFYPLRQKDVIKNVNDRLGEKIKINNYDIYILKKLINIENKKEYYFKSRFGSPQYSNGFVDLLLNEYEKNNSYFKLMREKFKHND